MLSCSIRFSAPSFWMGGGLESRFVGRVRVAPHTRRTDGERIRGLGLQTYPAGRVMKTTNSLSTSHCQK